ncbi:MAG: VCBS repeat-containing protein [Ignavibacteriae bacterium]|nr:VCBS repeat-containing protein [Ignavibacteriota bacterium]
MKNTYTFIVTLLFSLNLLHSQDSSWLVDVSNEAGLDSTLGTRILLVDVNNDNYPDLLWGSGNINKNRYHLYLNVPNTDVNSATKRIFVDFTDSSNINANRNPEKQGRIVDIAALADVNNDGNVDLVTSIYYHRLQMYLDTLDPGDRSEVHLGDGNGHFTLVTNNGLYQYGLINSTGLAFLDYDFDGKIDLYISTWFYDYANEIKQPDVLFKGNGDGSFTFIQNNGIQNVWEPMYGVNVTDWNNDGWQDVITSAYCRSGGSLFRNDKNGTFTDVAQIYGYTGQFVGGDHGQNLCQWEAQPADFDNDGDLDLLQVEVHGGYNPGEGRTHISVNQGPDSGYKYVWDLGRIRRDAPIESHLGDQGGQWLDIDGDGWLDVSIGQMGYADANLQGQERIYFLKQNKDHYFDDITNALGLFYMKEAHSMEPADYDLDGDQDVFLSRQIRDTTYVDSVINGQTQKIPVYSSHMKLVLLRNDIGNKNNWTSVKLKQPQGANQSGLGSRITVCSNGMNQISEIQAGLGHFAGEQPFIRNFGLGQNNRIDSIVIRWSIKNSPVTVVHNPPINLNLEIDSSGFRNYLKPWQGKKALIAFEEASLDFDTVNTGENKQLSFTLKNIGDTSLIVSNMYIDDSDSSVYSVNFQLNFSLEPGETRNFNVNFSPKFRAEYNGFINFESNAYNAPLKRFDLRGFGYNAEPLIATSTNELNFPTIWIDTVRVLHFSLQNIGELPLSVNDLKIENDTFGVFTCLNLDKQFVIPTGESRDVSIAFEPKELNEYSAQLRIISNAYNSQSYSVKLYGKCDGPSPQIEFSASTIFFLKTQVGQTREREIKIFNTGNSDLIINNIFVENDSNSIFPVTGYNLPLIIPPAGSDTIKIIFAPKASITYNMNLIVQSNSVFKISDTITLRGTGSVSGVSVENYIENESLLISILPNPITDYSVITVTIIDDKYIPLELSLYDLMGKKVYSLTNRKYSKGKYEFILNTNSFYSGLYYLSAVRGDSRFNILTIVIK